MVLAVAYILLYRALVRDGERTRKRWVLQGDSGASSRAKEKTPETKQSLLWKRCGLFVEPVGGLAERRMPDPMQALTCRKARIVVCRRYVCTQGSVSE